jgi:hypothetical protein
VGSLSDTFRTMFSPADAKALFTEEMSTQEKLKIRSALEAIDSPRRKEIFEITRRIVCTSYCPTGREKIVTALATKNLTLDEWHNIVSASSRADFGLKDGGERAQILLAMAALPPEKRDYCNQVFYWFTETTPVQDRVDLLKAFAYIRNAEELKDAKDLMYGLETGREIAVVLQAVGRMPESKDKVNWALWRTCREIEKTMTVEERVKKLEEAELSGWHSALNSKTLSTADQLQLKRVIEAYPDKSANIDYLASRFVTEPMNFHDRLLILSAIAALPPQERDGIIEIIRTLDLIAEPMSAEDRVKVLQAVRTIPLADRQVVSNCTRNLFTPSMTAEDRLKILMAFTALPPAERIAISTSANLLITHSMNAEDRLKILNATAALPSPKRLAIATCASQLVKYDMTAEDRLKILNAIAALPPQDLDAFGLIASQLISDTMDAEDRVRILTAMGALPPQDLEAISSFTKSMINRETSSEDRVKILNAVAALPALEREAIFNLAKKLFSPTMNVEDQVTILNSVAALPPQDLEALHASIRGLISQSMTAQDRVLVLNAAAALSPENRIGMVIYNPDEISAEALVALINDPVARHAHNAQCCANRLFTPAMSEEDKALLVNAFIALPSQNLDAIGWGTLALVNESMTTQERILILNAFAALSPENRSSIYIRNRRQLTAAAIIVLINDPAAREAHNEAPHMEVPVVPAGRFREQGIANAEFQRIEEEFDGGAAAVIYSLNNIIGEPIQRFCVDLSKLAQNPTAVLSKLSDFIETNHKFPSLRFWDAEKGISRGIDAGGLTRDFITKLFQALVRKDDDDRLLLPMKKQGKLSLPMVTTSSPMSVPDQIKYYEVIGHIYAQSLKSAGDNVIKTGPFFQPLAFQMIHHLSKDEVDRIPLHLSKVADIPEDIYKKELKNYLKIQWPNLFPVDAKIDALIANGTVTEEMLAACPKPEDMPEDIYKVQLKNYVKTLRPDLFPTDAAIEEFVTNGTVTEQMKALWPKDDDDPDAVDVTKDEVMFSVEFDKVIVPVLVIAKSMKENGANWDVIVAKSATDLEADIQGKVTKEIAKAAIVADIENLNDVKQQKKAFLIQYIDECTQEDLEKLCNAATGSRVLHPLKVSSSNAGPGFHTCFRSIDLPICANYDEFKALLSAAVDLAQTGVYSHG